jgi:hypothetical protein
VAALFDPALALVTVPLPGLAPEAAALARRLLEQARAGTLSPAELAHVHAGFFPGTADALRAGLEGAGRVDRVETLSERALGDDRELRFRCTFERAVADLTLVVAGDGKVASLRLR